MSTIELTGKVRELKELKIMAEELAAEITAIEEGYKNQERLRFRRRSDETIIPDNHANCGQMDDANP